MLKSRLDSDYDSEDEAKAAAHGETAQATAIKASRKARTTTSDPLIKQLLQMLTAHQSQTVQVLQERVDPKPFSFLRTKLLGMAAMLSSRVYRLYPSR